MRVRAALLTGTLALGVALVPLGAAPAAAACSYRLQLFQGAVALSRVADPPGYAYAIQPSSALPPGFALPFGGSLTAEGDGCRTSGVSVRFQSRDAGSRPFVTRRTVTTSNDGSFQLQASPSRTAVVRAVSTAPDGAELVSEPIVVRVRTAISATYTRGPGCRLFAEGSTFPAKPYQPIRLQVRVGEGFSTVASGVSDGRGVYRISWDAPCGKHDLATYVPTTATNDIGRTTYVRLRVEARR